MYSKRPRLQAKLKGYADMHPDPLEQEKVNTIRTFVDQNKHCFDRTNLYGHMTASAWVLNETYDRALLIHHRKLGLWLQPGGHADGEVNLLSVALKEAQEESGIKDFKILSEDIFDVDIHFIPANGQDSAHFHFDIRFLLQASSKGPLPSQNQEALALAWVPLFDIFRNPLYKNVRKMALKSKELVRSYGHEKEFSLAFIL